DGAGERGGGAEDEHPGRVELAALDQVEGVADAGVTFGGPEVAEDEAKGVGQLVGAGLVRRGKHGASRGGGGLIPENGRPVAAAPGEASPAALAPGETQPASASFSRR